jgi:hypothetical protein
LYADEACSPEYPDQFPFYPEEGCDDVTPLVWDHENSVSILDVNSSGTIYVTGGTLPLTVQVSGQGFWLDPEYTIRDSVVNGRSIGIYADGDACGAATIYIINGCSSVTGGIRSTNGRWDTEQISLNDCPFRGHGIMESSPVGGSFNIYNNNQMLSVKNSRAYWTDQVNLPCLSGYYCHNCSYAIRCSSCDGYDPCSTGENIPVARNPPGYACGGADAFTNHCMDTAEYYWPRLNETFYFTAEDGLLLGDKYAPCLSDEIKPSGVFFRIPTTYKYLSTWICN